MVDAIFFLSQLFGVAVHLPSRAHPLHAREAPPFLEGQPLSYLMGACAAGQGIALPRRAKYCKNVQKGAGASQLLFVCLPPADSNCLIDTLYFAYVFLFPPFTYNADPALHPIYLSTGSRQYLQTYKTHPSSETTMPALHYKIVRNNHFCNIHHIFHLYR